jgi:hypothetical protein
MKKSKVQKDFMSSKEMEEYLKNRVMEKFNKWITGQTCPVLDDGSFGYFLWDVERFADLILEGKPTYWD